MQQVIRRAELMGSRQLEGLRRALADGQSEQTLRRMGVIHEVDIAREFPGPEKKT